MSSDTGWRPFRPPVNPQRTVTSAFTRLARVHLASTSGDAAVAVALAGSLFFSLPSGQARGKVLLYLLLTMAPFVVVAPLVGPFLDRIRGARRIMVIVSAIGRAMLCFVMIGHIKSLLFFPEAFGVLILQKTYSVTKPALVPTTVANDEELVEANSKLSILSGVATATGAGPAGIAYKLGGAQWALGIALVIYVIAAALGTQLPRAQAVATDPTSSSERAELHSASILLGASAMAMVRGIVGFLTLFLAFEFHREGVPLWKLGVVGISSVAGSLIGALIAPRLRRLANQEENLLLGALFAIVVGGLAAVLLGGLNGAMALAVIVGIGAAVGKLAFDSIVQRDAPDANRGRSFARFETRFQAAWVIGAVIAIAPMPSTVGYVVILIAAIVTAFSYVIGAIAARARASHQPPSGIDATAVQIDERMSALASDTKERLRRAAGSALHRGITGPIGRHTRSGHTGGDGSLEESERGRRRGRRRATDAKGWSEPPLSAEVDTAGWSDPLPVNADVDTAEVPIVPPPPQPRGGPPGSSRAAEPSGSSPPATEPPGSSPPAPAGSPPPPPPPPKRPSSPPVGRGASPRR